MPGDARALLEQMRLRLERGAHAALGISEPASLPVARAAFLQLTKTYHPVKFAREAPDVVRQANEIFLALRSSYDQVTQQGRRASQVMPPSAAVGRATGSVPIRTGAGSPPPPIGQPATATPAAASPATAATAATAPAPATTVVSLKPGSPAASAIAPPAGSSAQRQPAKPASAAKPGSGTVSGVGAPARNDRTQQLGLRPTSGAAPSAPAAPSTSSTTAPAGAVPAPARAPAPAAARPGIAAVPKPPAAPTPVAKQTGAIPKLSDGVAPGSEEADLEIAMYYIKRKQWSDARKQLHALAARVPADKRYRALLSYARGREQQDDGRHDEARAEFTRALQLDPDLYMAKSALQQIGSLGEEPEKPSGGGLFSRLFKK